MTAIAIAIAVTCIAVTAFYSIILYKAEEPELTDEQLAEMSVDRKWWHAN